MTRQIMDGATDVEEAGEPAKRVTLGIPTHLAAPSRRFILRDGPKLTRATRRHPARGRASPTAQ